MTQLFFSQLQIFVMKIKTTIRTWILMDYADTISETLDCDEFPYFAATFFTASCVTYCGIEFPDPFSNKKIIRWREGNCGDTCCKSRFRFCDGEVTFDSVENISECDGDQSGEHNCQHFIPCHTVCQPSI